MAKDKGISGIDEEETDDDFESEDEFESDDVGVDLEMDNDDIVSDDDDFEEEEEAPRPRPVAKRRVQPRSVPHIEGVPKTKLTDAAVVEEVWQKLDDRFSDVEATPYALSVQLEEGSVIGHAKFGRGFVIEITPPNKAEVIFRDAVRKLIFGRG